MKLMYINGEFTKGSASEEIEVTNPATEEVLDTVPRGTAEDVDAAVKSGREAFKSWRKIGANERTSLLHKIATSVRHHKGELIQLLTLEEGKLSAIKPLGRIRSEMKISVFPGIAIL